jgi:hypothetical protein
MSGEVTYIFADLLTNEILGEMSLFGTYFEKYVNNTGNCNFSYKLGQGGTFDSQLDDRLALQCTIPGRTALYVDRDGELVWGGILWSRTYQSQAKTVSCTAQTFESYFAHRVAHLNALYVASVHWDQRNLVADLIMKMAAEYSDGSSDLGFILPDTFPTEVERTLNVWAYNFGLYSDFISGVYQLDDGFDFMADVAYLGGAPRRFIYMGYPNLGDPTGDPNMTTFDYPGPIANYYWPETASAGANNAWSVGAGDGTKKIFGNAVDTPSLAAGYPRLDIVNSYTDVTRQPTIDAHAASDLAAALVPNSVPSITLNPQDFGFNGLQVGTYARLVIEDVRFPDGFDTEIKVNGWQWTPKSSSGSETVNLVIAGADQ